MLENLDVKKKLGAVTVAGLMLFGLTACGVNEDADTEEPEIATYNEAEDLGLNNENAEDSDVEYLDESPVSVEELEDADLQLEN